MLISKVSEKVNPMGFDCANTFFRGYLHMKKGVWRSQPQFQKITKKSVFFTVILGYLEGASTINPPYHLSNIQKPPTIRVNPAYDQYKNIYAQSFRTLIFFSNQLCFWFDGRNPPFIFILTHFFILRCERSSISRWCWIRIRGWIIVLFYNSPIFLSQKYYVWKGYYDWWLEKWFLQNLL